MAGYTLCSKQIEMSMRMVVKLNASTADPLRTSPDRSGVGTALSEMNSIHHVQVIVTILSFIPAFRDMLLIEGSRNENHTTASVSTLNL